MCGEWVWVGHDWYVGVLGCGPGGSLHGMAWDVRALMRPAYIFSERLGTIVETWVHHAHHQCGAWEILVMRF